MDDKSVFLEILSTRELDLKSVDLEVDKKASALIGNDLWDEYLVTFDLNKVIYISKNGKIICTA